MKYFLSIGAITAMIGIGFFACEDPAITNPNDPSYELSAPTLLSAEAVTDTSIALTWKNNEEHASQFVINRKVSSGAYRVIGTVSNEILTFIDTNCDLGTYYNYTIQSKIESNLSSNSNPLYQATIFINPTVLTATLGTDESLRLNWIDNTSFEEGFKIERDDGGGFIEIGVVPANIVEYTDSELPLGQSLDYRVAAFTVNNTSDYTIALSVAIPLFDIDGNVYNTVTIGTQVWMAENLNVTHYRDGTGITHVTDNAVWAELTTEAYCIYNNNASNEADTYGALYNWYAVNGDIDGNGTKDKEIAPRGWHVPSHTEWLTLVDYLGGTAVAGGKMKEAGTSHWFDPNTGATNESGFTALPAGTRIGIGNYSGINLFGYFWSSTEYTSYAWYRNLISQQGIVTVDYVLKGYGFSVRCVKD